MFFFSPIAGLEGIYIKRVGPAEIRVNAFSNITFSCLLAIAALDDEQVTWNFKNQSDPLKQVESIEYQH